MKQGIDRDSILSPREIQVANMICHEWTCREIADQLGLSTTTIITHMVRIKKKLGVSNIAGVVREYVRNGWLDEQRISGGQARAYHTSIITSAE